MSRLKMLCMAELRLLSGALAPVAELADVDCMDPDREALLECLESRKVDAAGLDVIEGEWMEDMSQHALVRYAQTHDNHIITPQIASAAVESIAGDRIHAGRMLAYPIGGTDFDVALDQLEAQSIYILREAYREFSQLVMLWSIGKDSTVLLWLARKAFFGHVPIPLMHIDTGYKIPAMIAYRDRLAREWRLNMIVGRNESDFGRCDFPTGTATRLACCKSLTASAMVIRGLRVCNRVSITSRAVSPIM